MCGLTGYVDLTGSVSIDKHVLISMADTLEHRGPDSSGYFIDNRVGFGFRRLSIIGIHDGDQPIYNEDQTLILMCNGEIYNYLELKMELENRGHRFKTKSDVEVIIHLYEEMGAECLIHLNGQFAFVIYDRKTDTLFCARDHFGIQPFYYGVFKGSFLFGSEIKAILAHPSVDRHVDLTGLDQIFSFPGLVSPRTMFQGISSLRPGHFLFLQNGKIEVKKYWDINYPNEGEIAYNRSELSYEEELEMAFKKSVLQRLQADVPVGFYLSGGLDSSLIGAMIKKLAPQVERHSFSIVFDDKNICESKYQRIMADRLNSIHHEISFNWNGVDRQLYEMIYHAESPVKEIYNICSMQLSATARAQNIKVVLSGEGADELFAGYVGYRLDQSRVRNLQDHNLESVLDEQIRAKIWGHKSIFYESNQYSLRELNKSLYSTHALERFADFDCLNFQLVDVDQMSGRHTVHQRSFLDFKLRLADHLLADHGDRMNLAHSVEGRYPFLDVDLFQVVKQIPPHLKLNDFIEKYILKKMAKNFVPDSIINREKFGFQAPGSPYLIQSKLGWVEDLLSYERIRKQGYFNPDVIEWLKKRYSQQGFALHPHLDTDLLLVVLTFGIFLEVFQLPSLA
jgi:asparagine synthase (glutamine-hydrolysing)